jgi:hypothetical protein
MNSFVENSKIIPQDMLIINRIHLGIYFTKVPPFLCYT